MDYRDRANIITVSERDDGMGGLERVEYTTATIKCKVAPYTVKTINSAGLPLTYSRNKLFTKDKSFVDDIYSDYFIKYKDIEYKKISVMDAGKCLIIEMERADK
jgi:hypothetical protein